MESVPVIGVRRLTRFESVKKKAATGHAKCRCHAATEHIWKCHQRPFLPSCTLCFCSRLPSVHILTRCLSTKDSSLELFILWEGYCCICKGQIKVKIIPKNTLFVILLNKISNSEGPKLFKNVTQLMHILKGMVMHPTFFLNPFSTYPLNPISKELRKTCDKVILTNIPVCVSF